MNVSRKGWPKQPSCSTSASWLGRKVDQSFLEDLESRLIQADVGIAATTQIINQVRETFAEKTADENLLCFVKAELKRRLEDPMVGTLSVASEAPECLFDRGGQWVWQDHVDRQAAQHLKDKSNTILLAACDTFRAAAADQLSIWAERARTEIVKGAPGADPASIAHDACQRALARHIDVMIVDTAGRLHTQAHLMRELEKIRNVIQRMIPVRRTKYCW